VIDGTHGSFLKLASAETLRSAQDSEAAEFWQALVHRVVSVADHKMATADQSAKEYAEVLLHEMREVDIVGDAKLARLELTAFLTRCFRLQAVSWRFTLPSGEYYCFHQDNKRWLNDKVEDAICITLSILSYLGVLSLGDQHV